MLENEELTDRIIHIIKYRNKFDENSVFDYKEKPYLSKKATFKFVRNVLSFLNSYQRVSEDRFIIYGIKNMTRELMPVSEEIAEKWDDANVQTKIRNWISPDPYSVEMKQIQASLISKKFTDTEYFLALYIPFENFGEVYELKEDMPEIEDEEENNNGKIYCAGTSFTRYGSSTIRLTEYHRKIIRSIVKQPVSQHNHFRATSLGRLDNLFMLSWDENNNNDKEIIKRFTNIDYLTVQKQVKTSISDGDGIFSYSKGEWSVINFDNYFKKFLQETTENDLNNCKNLVLDILTDIDTKYELDADKRIMGNIYKKSSKFSLAIKKGVVEFLNYVGNNGKCFPLIDESKIKEFVDDIVYQALLTDNWMVLATLNNMLPYLAEASSGGYIAGINQSLNKSDAIKKFLNEKELSIGEIKYGQLLVVGVEVIGRDKDCLSSSFNLLVKLSKFSEYAKESITRLLLPWNPQTTADKEKRKGYGKTLAKHDNLWLLMLSWLPGKHTMTSYVWDTKYKENIDISKKISLEELNDVSISYAKDLLESMSSDDKRIKAIIESLNSYLRLNLCDNFINTFNEYFKSLDLTKPDDVKRRYMIWDLLNLTILLWKNSSNPMHEIYKQNKEKIIALIDLYDFKDVVYEARRLFSHDTHQLISREDWRKEEEELQQLRIKVLEQLYNEQGFDGILRVCCYKVDEELMGILVAHSSICNDVFTDMIELIKNNSSNYRLAQGYLWNRNYNNNIKIFIKEDLVDWSQDSIVKYFSSFPTERKFWMVAEELLSDKAEKYWQVAKDVRENLNDDDLRHYCEKMNSVGRFRETLITIALMLYKNNQPKPDIVYNALIQINGDTVFSGISTYDLKQCIIYLENVNYDSKKLFGLEWKAYVILKDEDEGSLFIHKEISRSSEAFIYIFNIYKGDFSFEEKEPTPEQKQQMGKHAYDILLGWKETPGLIDDDFDYGSFLSWVDNITKNIKDDYIKEFWQFLGKNLFYSPKDKSGIFINKNIASYININEKLIDAYTREAFNSRGVFTVDETGKAEDELADKYDEQAEDLEELGFTDFAEGLRKLAQDYRRWGKKHREDN